MSGRSIAEPPAAFFRRRKAGGRRNVASVKSEKPQERERLGLVFGGRGGTRTYDISIMNAAL